MMNHDYDETIQIVVSVLIGALILVAFGVCVMFTSAQADCYQFPESWVYEDITDDIYAIYDLWYSGDMAKQRQAVNRLDEYGMYLALGRYEAQGYWLEVFLTDESQFVAYIGDDWTIGADGILHNPCRVVLLNRFDRRDYTRITNR